MSVTRFADPQQEREWIAGLRAERLDVFRAVFDAYMPILRRFARVWTPNDVAEDIVQDVLFDLWRRRATFDVHSGNLSAYLFSAVRNRALKHVRHQGIARRTEEVTAPVDPPGMGAGPAAPDSQLITDELHAKVRDALATLPDVQRAVLMLRWTQGLSYAQISAALDISENAAMLHVSRARRALRPFLHDLVQELD